MNALKITMLTLLILVGTLVATLAGVGVYVWTHPKETWELVQQHFLPEDLKITWQDLDVRLRRVQGLEFSMEGRIEQLSVVKVSPSIDIPVDHLHWRFILNPLAKKNILVIQDIDVDARQDMKFTAGPPDDSPSEQNPFEKVESYLNLLRKSEKFKIQNFNVHVEKFIFTSFTGASTEIVANLVRSQKTRQDVIDFNLAVQLPGDAPAKIAAQGNLNLDRFSTDLPFLNSQIQVSGWGVETQQKLLLQTEGGDTLLRSTGSVVYKKDKIKLDITPDLWARIKPSEAIFVLKVNAHGLPGPYVKIQGLEARLTIPFAEGTMWSDQASVFSVALPLQLFFIDKNLKPPLEKACECKIPETLKAELTGKTWFRELLGHPRERKPVLESKFHLESLKNKLVSVDLSAEMNILKKSREYFLEPRLDSHVVLHSFRGLRNFLDAKNILIPAPFDVLDGTIDLTAAGPINERELDYQFPLNAKVRLSSKDQQVNVDSDSVVTLARKMDAVDFHVKVSILDLQLELPPLNPVGGMPKVASDARILKKPKIAVVKKPRAQKTFKVTFEFELDTATPGAIRLLSGYANPYLPLSISLRADRLKETKGFLQTEPFKVEYLRRTVQVEKFRLDLENIEKNILPLSGRLRIDQADYKVFINFEGTVQQPQISLTSEPYLSQSEIISVLLYGRPNDLDSSDAQTAGSFEAAMADRAIGIFGLWAFAATPIQSFSYNPLTKVYTATVKITDDVTAGIGTNWEESARLELRKRVSQRWMLTASWTPNEAGDVEEKLVLQWEQRF
jgi:hypothetical protein